MFRAGLTLLLFTMYQQVLLAQHPASAPCDSASTTASMHECWDGLARQADSTLQRYLTEARRVSLHRALVDSTQRVWVRYRDLQCRAAGSEFDGGSLEPVAVVICYYDLTRARTDDIWAAYLSNPNNSLPEPSKTPRAVPPNKRLKLP